MAWIALCIVLGQAAVIGTLLWFVRSFGSYTAALLHAHESNIMMRNEVVRAIEALRAERVNPEQGKVA